ncbi:MAG: histidine--tRNA ligase [Actinomycetota bacterium]
MSSPRHFAPRSLEPPSGTRDFLASELRVRESAFATIRAVFERYGFDPLQTPAFERLDVLTGKYGDEGDKLIFKILRRGEHEASGEADLGLRYDLTVPLARVVGGYGSQLPSPYRRYAIGPVWRADRPGRGRFREFMQCDVDIVGSSAPLADAEVLCAIHDALATLGIAGFRFLVNSRQALSGLLHAYGVPAEIGGGVLIALDKLDKLTPDDVMAELERRRLAPATAKAIVHDLITDDAPERMRALLAKSERGQAGLADVDRLLELVAGAIPQERIAFTPHLVRGLDYYTGVVWEVVASDLPASLASGGRYDGLVAALGGPDLPAVGGSLGIERILAILPTRNDEADRIDIAVTLIDENGIADLMTLAAELRRGGLRVELYLGSSAKLARQLRWAADRRGRHALIYGHEERVAGEITVRDMDTGEQNRLPIDKVAAYLKGKE